MSQSPPAPPTSPPEDGSREDFLVFRIGGEHFAIQAVSLRQILESPPIVPLPNAPPHLLGIINLRGEILAVIDLRVPFDLGPSGSHPEERLVVLRWGKKSVALVADAVLSIESLQRSNLEPVPLDLPEIHRRTFLGQARLRQDLSVSVMDPSAVFLLPQFKIDTKSSIGRPHG